MSLDFKSCIDKELISKKTQAVYDFEFVKALENLPWSEWIGSPSGLRCRLHYLERAQDWILSSQLNRIEGLSYFQRRDLINGTTQSFDEAYFRHSHRRLRFFRGEYAYHRRVFPNWLFIEDAPIEKNDFIIISAPFCSTGDVHPEHYNIMEVATQLRVPVIVDAAYFGTCEGFFLKVDYPCVESVSFSLSKGLGLGDVRSGIRFSNLDENNSISQQNKYDHTVLAAAQIGIYMMNLFGPDFIPSKYSSAQKEVCLDLGLHPTKCMHLANCPLTEPWLEFIIDGKYGRVGIRNLVKARKKKLA